MKEPRKTILYWSPRVVSILFAIYITYQSAKNFGALVAHYHSFWWTLWNEMIPRLTPAFLVLAVGIVSWRKESLGAMLYGILAVIYLMGIWEYLMWENFLGILLPLIVLALLWFLGWRYKKKYLREQVE